MTTHSSAKTIPSIPPGVTLTAMSNKQIVADLMERLPTDVSLLDIAREIEFVAGAREDFAQLDRGEGLPLEKFAQQLPSWISK